MEIWELITQKEQWCKGHLALDHNGTSVCPHNINAVSFSLIGGLIRCYIPVDEVWNDQYERRRSGIFNAVVHVPQLLPRIKSCIGKSSLKSISLPSLNDCLDYLCVAAILTHMRNEKGES